MDKHCQIFSITLFDALVTLQYYAEVTKSGIEWVKLDELCRQFDIYYIYSFRENGNIKGFVPSGQPDGRQAGLAA